MKDILKMLYYTELEENEELLLHKKGDAHNSVLLAYQNLLSTLSDKQKALFFVYEEKNNAMQCDFDAEVYRLAFKTAFRFALDILSDK